MMEDNEFPETQPSSALDPPRRNPPTAVATATPGPAPDRRPRAHVTRSPIWHFLKRSFDVIDMAADTIAEAINLRPV